MRTLGYLLLKDGNKLYYNTVGNGKALVCLHGFGADHKVFRFMEKSLSKKYKVITLDLRGHGNSTSNNTNLSIKDFADDLNQLLEHLKIESFCLLGYSMGGAVALEYIRIYGDEKIESLILVESTLKIINDDSWEFGLFNGKYDLEAHQKTLDMIENNWEEFCKDFVSKLSNKLKELDYKNAVENLKKNDKKLMLAIWDNLSKTDYRNIPLDFKKRVLYISGRESSFYNSITGEIIVEMFKEGLFIDIRGGHLLLLENPVEVNRVIENFINQNCNP